MLSLVLSLVPLIAVTLGFFVSVTALNVAVLHLGWGLAPVSWAWILGLGICGHTFNFVLSLCIHDWLAKRGDREETRPRAGGRPHVRVRHQRDGRHTGQKGTRHPDDAVNV